MGRAESSKKYYETHKAEIAEKDKKRWVSYYEKNKETIKRKNLERYYAKKALNPPPQPDDNDKKYEERLQSIVEELRELIPKMMKPPRKRKAKNESSELGVEVIVPTVEP